MGMATPTPPPTDGEKITSLEKQVRGLSHTANCLEGRKRDEAAASKARADFEKAVSMLAIAVNQHPGDFSRILQRACEMVQADRRFVAVSGALPISKE